MAKRNPNFVDAHVGVRMRVRRQIIGMSQERLGELLGITFQQVQKYEKGSNRVSASRLYLMAKVLGVPVQYFFDGLPDSDKEGFAEESRSSAVIDACASPEGIQLNRIFSEIADPNRRKLVVSLVKAVAEQKD
jgi:transcriptional regulator with XRE-family HTH domain